ncbi:MAG: T9SS type A sorting domain-containing protein [Bacteroidetes bacterium]|nr:T9SS type A sorting domain-containing protein [Bacteroidota bacterium]
MTITLRHYFPLGLLLFSMVLSAQGWEQTYPDSIGRSAGFDVQQTVDGGFALAGETDYPTGAIRQYIRLIKTDENGNLEWSKTYKKGWITMDEARTVEQTKDNGFIIGGSSNGQMILVKTDENGDTLWTKTYGAIIRATGHAARQAQDGGYVFAGRADIEEITLLASGAILIKTDTEGNKIWRQEYYFEPGNLTWANDVQLTIDGGYVLTGYQNGRVLLFKTNSEGDTSWVQRYGFSEGDEGLAVRQTSDNGFIVCGYGSGFAGQSPLVFKTDGEGQLLWQVFLSSPSLGTAADIHQTMDGGYIITGSLQTLWGFYYPAFIVKLNSDGTEQWAKVFTTEDQIASATIRQTDDEGYIMGGLKGNDMYLLKLDSLGNTTPNATEDLTLPDSPEVEVFPNPASETVTFKFKSIFSDKLQLRIFSPEGKIVLEQKVHQRNLQIDTSSFYAGMYFYSIESEGNICGRGKILLY